MLGTFCGHLDFSFSAKFSSLFLCPEYSSSHGVSGPLVPSSQFRKSAGFCLIFSLCCAEVEKLSNSQAHTPWSAAMAHPSFTFCFWAIPVLCLLLNVFSHCFLCFVWAALLIYLSIFWLLFGCFSWECKTGLEAEVCVLSFLMLFQMDSYTLVFHLLVSNTWTYNWFFLSWFPNKYGFNKIIGSLD